MKINWRMRANIWPIIWNHIGVPPIHQSVHRHASKEAINKANPQSNLTSIFRANGQSGSGSGHIFTRPNDAGQQVLAHFPLSHIFTLKGAHFGSPFGYGQPLGQFDGGGPVGGGASTSDTPPQSHRLPTIAVQQPSLPYGGIGAATAIHAEQNGPTLNNGYGGRGHGREENDLEEEEDELLEEDEEEEQRRRRRMEEQSQQPHYRPGPSSMRQRF